MQNSNCASDHLTDFIFPSNNFFFFRSSIKLNISLFRTESMMEIKFDSWDHLHYHYIWLSDSAFSRMSLTLCFQIIFSILKIILLVWMKQTVMFWNVLLVNKNYCKLFLKRPLAIKGFLFEDGSSWKRLKN
jgi:hypothetical protein